MKVILVRPPFVDIRTGPPIGLAYISRAFKELGHEVEVMDLNLEIHKKYPDIGNYTRDFILPGSHDAIRFAYKKLDDYCQEILSMKPGIVGFSLTYPTLEYGMAMAKQISKYARCIAGGPEATFHPKQLLSMGFFDTVVCGYGEEGIVKAIDERGIIVKSLNRSKEYLPDFSRTPIERYNGRLPVLMTRGCSNRCYFCTQHLSLYSHSIESVVNQIKNTPGIREVMYNDSNINMDSNKTEQLFTKLSKLSEPFKGHIFGLQIKKDFKRYISKMASSGVKIVRVGIESGSIRERNSMNKPSFDNETVVELVKELTSHKILTWAQFIFCYPDQTGNDRQQTVNLMNMINDSCDHNYVKQFWYKFVVHHGTEKFFKKKYGVITSSPGNWENSLYSCRKIEEIEEKYSRIIPENAKIYL